MIFKGNVYLVCVDGLFAGICEDEYEIGDVASDFINGVREIREFEKICENNSSFTYESVAMTHKIISQISEGNK